MGRNRFPGNGGNNGKKQGRIQTVLLLLNLLAVLTGTAIICLFVPSQFKSAQADDKTEWQKTGKDTGNRSNGKEDIQIEDTQIEDTQIAGNQDASVEQYTETGAQETAAAEKETEWRERAAWESILYNQNLYPEEMLTALKRNPEILDFVSGYLEAGGEAHGTLTEEEKKEDTPLFLQWDERWGYAAYGETNIGISGCGPTALSMVLFSLTGEESLTPQALAETAMSEGYYVSGEGTAWSFMTEIPPKYGVFPIQMSSWTEEMVKQYLDDGKLLICAMRPGDFTDTGHFIVIRGYRNGKVLVNDPFSISNSEKEWDYETVSSQCRQMWAFE